MRVREPRWAGLFYEGSARLCREQLEACLRWDDQTVKVSERVIGGIVPHAGWPYSGEVAASVFKALASQPAPETVVLLGTWHRGRGSSAVLCSNSHWRTPLGEIEVDALLAEALLKYESEFVVNLEAHQEEHSIEVQVPFIQYLLPKTKILPILVPAQARSVRLTDCLVRALGAIPGYGFIVASTDLTHYGPRYGYTPQGIGDSALTWAKEVNDRRMIDLMLTLDADAIVPESREHHNACGAGAVATVIASSKALGADSATLLRHATSHDSPQGAASHDAVGYAGIVFHTRNTASAS